MLKKYIFKPSWASFYEQFKSDLKLWCYFVLFQQICRVYFIFSLSHYLIPETKISTIIHAMVAGLRFDSLWATCWLLVSLAFFTLPCSLFDRIKHKANDYRRLYLGGVFTFVTGLLYLAAIEYFREYKDIFNQFLFGWFYDDKGAILKTIYAEHNVISSAILLSVLMLVYIKFSKFFIPTIGITKNILQKQYRFIYKMLVTSVIAIFYIAGFRGGLGPRPVQLKDAGITKDVFLNKAVVSPYSALKYAIDDYLEMSLSNNSSINLSASEVRSLAKEFFGSDNDYSTLDRYLEKRTKGSEFPRPKHIFLIVGESLDAWPLKDEYADFELTPNLKQIISKGIHFKHFLSSTCGTMSTLNTLITGIPDVGLHTNYEKSAVTPYATTLATQFKRLGFKPQFFYGGYLSWQNLDGFAYAQDFSKVYGAAHINNWLETNEWGVDDRGLFNFIIDTVKDEQEPTFNIIMTTSNHPPFSINLEREGFDKDKAARLLAKYHATDTNVRELGHIWYSDKAIGEFVEKVSAFDDDAIFVITGDHFGRRHILANPSSLDLASVPLIIYGPNIKRHPFAQKADTVAGSHLDIGSTLIELIAPKDTVYYSMGDNLLSKRKFNFGIGYNKIITPEFIASIDSDSSDSFEYFEKAENISHKELSKFKNEHEVLSKRFKQAMSIARYIIKTGEVIDEPCRK